MSLSGPASPRAPEPKRMILSGENRSAIRRTRSARTAGLSATSLMVSMITRTAPANLGAPTWARKGDSVPFSGGEAVQRLRFQRLLAAAQAFLNRGHVGVERRGQVEGDELREEQAADYHQAQGLAGFAARAVAQRDRDGAQERGHGGHHDRAETDQAALINCFHGLQAALALGFQGEIDLHDGVLLHDADQHDEADERIKPRV